MENYYTLLGVPTNVSPDELKRKFRQIQLRLHSQKNNDSCMNDEYKSMCDAYKILSNDNLKEQYDKTINRDLVVKDETVFETQINTKTLDMFSIIGEQLLNNVMKNISNTETNNTNSQPISATSNNILLPTKEVIQIPPLVQVFYVTYYQAYKGCVLPIEIQRKIYTSEISTSFTNEIETIYINIPKGIDNNEILFFPEKGDIVGNNHGELKVTIKLEANNLYKRNGLDLIYIKSLTLKEALCGTVFNIEHFNDKVYKISTQGHVVSSTNEQRIPDLGFQRMDCSPIGDLVVNFEIEFPEKLSQECINQLLDILP